MDEMICGNMWLYAGEGNSIGVYVLYRHQRWMQPEVSMTGARHRHSCTVFCTEAKWAVICLLPYRAPPNTH